MSLDNEEKNIIIENIKVKNIKNNKSPENSKQSKTILSSPNNTKKEKKKRNKKKKNEKQASNEKNFNGGILSEIKQISIPSILEEKENLFKILQTQIINIDKGISLLNKKKKYYNEIIEKLCTEIQNEKKNLKTNEIKNKEYLYMENILKNYDINDTFENIDFIDNNSYYNINKTINNSLDYNYFLLNQKNYKNILVINFLDEKNKTHINNKMESNYNLSYEEFNNITELDDNFCLLSCNINNDNNNIDDNNTNDKDYKRDEIKILNNNNELNININDDNKIICESEEEQNHNINIKENISKTPYKNKIEVDNKEFEIIDEAPPEEEETNNKKRKKISIENNKYIIDNNNINNNSENKIKEKEKDSNDIDRSIKKNYSNNFEELDFYLFKDSRKKEIKENKKKKITFEDIQKKYKTQDMGSDFINKEDSSNNNSSSEENSEKKEKLKKKEKEKDNNKKIKKKNNNKIKNKDYKLEEKEDSNNINSTDNYNYNDESSDISKELEDNSNSDNGNKKKRGRKKKKKDLKISFSLEEELPDPENLDSIALALEMKKYGMKPQNKKRNIEILKSVYKFLKIRELPENISKKLTTFDLDIDDNNTDSEKDNKINSKSKKDISNMTELDDELKKKIIEIIKENKNIYEKILLFKEISIKEIKTLLNSKGIIVQNHLLSKLLINSGVVLPGGWNDKK